ncbi:MAG: DUF4157 domain-containing protein [Desulfobulbaceae bacterium]|nr:DUF4157 domain-containing protein [Desulfobulbaceae bacterium]
MAPRIIWRYRRKRHTIPAAKSRKQDRVFGSAESQAAGSVLHMQMLEKQEAQNRVQLAEEEEVQAQLQEEEEGEEMVQTQLQEAEEEEEVQAQLQEEEEGEEVVQPQLQEAEEEEEVQTQLQEEEEGEKVVQTQLQEAAEEEEAQTQLQEEEEEEAQPKVEPVRKRSNRLIRSVAKSGFKGNPGSYPFRHRIQAAFGNHDISNVKVFSDSNAQQANRRLGALAYASREKVAFRGYPDLHTAAHEAAHIIQQRQGVRLKDGKGRKGDPYERHADAVADRVVQGKSVQSLLNSMPSAAGNAKSAVQLKDVSEGQTAYRAGNWALEVCGRREKKDTRSLAERDPQGLGAHAAQRSAFAETDPKGAGNKKIISFDAASLEEKSKPMAPPPELTEVTSDIWDVKALRTVLFDEEPRFDDIMQSSINSCYLLAVLLSLTNTDKGLATIREIVSETPDAFVVKFYQILEGGVPDTFRNFHVTVPHMRASWQANVPLQGPYPLNDEVQGWLRTYFPIPPYATLIGDYYKQVAWAWAIEKAFATVVGDWQGVEGGDAGTAFLVLLGSMGNALIPKDGENLVAIRLFNQIYNKFRLGTPMTVTPRDGHEIPASFTHTYHVVHADEYGVTVVPRCKVPKEAEQISWDTFFLLSGKTYAKGQAKSPLQLATGTDILAAWRTGHTVYGSWYPSVNYDGKRFFLSQHAYSITGIDAKTISLEEPYGRFPLHALSRKEFCSLFSIIYAPNSF